MALKNTREVNYPEWYQNVVAAADMAENSASPGCMVIKSWGYGIWENIRNILTNSSEKPDMTTVIFRCLSRSPFFRKKPTTSKALPKKWP